MTKLANSPRRIILFGNHSQRPTAHLIELQTQFTLVSELKTDNHKNKKAKSGIKSCRIVLAWLEFSFPLFRCPVPEEGDDTSHQIGHYYQIQDPII